jgi:hypothetical protein
MFRTFKTDLNAISKIQNRKSEKKNQEKTKQKKIEE